MRRYPLLKRLLSEYGVEDARVRMEWVSASEGQRFAEIVADMTHKIRSLGPSSIRAKTANGQNGEVRKCQIENYRLPCIGEPGAAVAMWPFWTQMNSFWILPRRADIRLWPIAADGKYQDVEQMLHRIFGSLIPCPKLQSLIGMANTAANGCPI
jgi:F420-non-reducing hydrogenase iron-sulfur subunit